ncbi:MAG TPA: virulence factor TspB C-terminal domain-related protein [Xylella sp.]
MVGFMGRHSFFLYFVSALVFFFPDVLLAQTDPSAISVSVVPLSDRYSSATAAGVDTVATFEGKVAGIVDGVKYYDVPVSLSSSTLGQLAKGAISRGLGLYNAYTLLKGLMDGAGWVVDDLTHEVKTGPPPKNVPSGSYLWCITLGTATSCSVNPAALSGAIEADCNARRPQDHSHVVNSFRIDEQRWGYAIYEDSPNDVDFVAYWVRISEDTHDYADGVPSVVTDTDLGQLVRTDPSVVNSVLVDPQTGAVIKTPEIVKAMNDLQHSLEDQYKVAHSPDQKASGDFSASVSTQTSWPSFCGWARVVCDFMDWVKKSDGADDSASLKVPYVDLPSSGSSWSSGLGAGACPAPVPLSLSFGGIDAKADISYQPLCDFASYIRAVVIAMASIYALTIISGMRGVKGA